MARAVRKKELRLEERLEAALVPEGEQPYAVPGNWCWVRLKSIAKWGSGGTPSRKKPEYYTGEVPWIKTGELNDGYIYETEEHITEEALENSSAKLFPVNTVVIAMYGATIGKVGILGVEAATNQACACGVCTEAVIYKFLFHYACSQKDDFVNKSKGGAQPNISQDIIKNHSIPIPPLAEQQRIVNMIESLFADLDEAKEKLSAVLEGFTQRKAVILHQAFTGELTAKWREENGESFESWETVRLQEVCEKITCGKTPKEFISEAGEIPFLKVYNIVNNEIDFEKSQYIPKEIHDSKLKSSILKPNDVVMNIVGPPLRKIAIVPDTYDEWNMNQAIVRFRSKERLDYRYLYYALLNPQTLDAIIQETRGVVGQANISISQARNLEIPLPLMNEQREIVRILDQLFEDEQQAQASVEAVLEDIDTIKKSILARAFRGELGTNEPGEENAREMLKRVL